MTLLAHIADRVIGRPLLLHPQKAELIASVIADRIGIDPMIDDPEVLPEQLTAPLTERPAANRFIGEPIIAGRRELYRRAGGVGIIPVVGSLVNRGLSIGESSGFLSYESLGAQLRAALADPLVQSIMLDMDSAGGEASGMFSLASAIRQARSQKPITALVDDMATSAAYGLASQATDIVVSPTSFAGSIGVVLMHVDRSGELEKRGRKTTLIHAGAHKIDANPFGPLSDSVRADLQREVNGIHERFIEAVAAGRPKLTAELIRATEARTYIGSEVIEAGLADRIGTFDETLDRMAAQNSFIRNHKTGGFLMSNPENMIARADHEAALASATATARTEGERAGYAAAVDRVRAIMSLPEAEGREAMARVFALDSDMAPEVAARALAAAPAGSAAPPRIPALDARSNPPVPGALPPNPQVDSQAIWDRSLRKAGARMPQ